jgi:hypothetical protein
VPELDATIFRSPLWCLLIVAVAVAVVVVVEKEYFSFNLGNNK